METEYSCCSCLNLEINFSIKNKIKTTKLLTEEEIKSKKEKKKKF